MRDLAERGVLQGPPGGYVSTVEAADISMPATVQTTIAARIDRLDSAAKRTLSAAAVIGSTFSRDLLDTLGIEPALDDLVTAQFIDQMTFIADPAFVFHHPLVRTVAYETQLKSDRADLHRRLAAAIEVRAPASADENAALIAEHLEAAGDLHAAYGWHMRGAAWSNLRDVAAAQLGWERACEIADQLPAGNPDRAAMRIAPRALLCGNAPKLQANISARYFEELRELCTQADDKVSLAIGMVGLLGEHLRYARVREASLVASEQMALIESIGDPTLTVGLACGAIAIQLYTGEIGDVLRWSQTVIDLADGDPAKGNFLMGSPLAVALAQRGVARWCLGHSGWQDDLDNRVAKARNTDAFSYTYVLNQKYGVAIPNGVLLADEAALREIREGLRIAERSAGEIALGSARFALGVALVHRDYPADRDRGLELLAQVRDMCVHQEFPLTELPFIDVYIARERARDGDRDGATTLIRAAVDDLFTAGQPLGWGVPATGVLVETLLDRGADSDVAEAEAAITRLAQAPADDGLIIRGIWVLRLQALLAQAHGDAAAYADFRDRYCDMATTLGFEGHIDWSEAMT